TSAIDISSYSDSRPAFGLNRRLIESQRKVCVCFVSGQPEVSAKEATAGGSTTRNHDPPVCLYRDGGRGVCEASEVSRYNATHAKVIIEREIRIEANYQHVKSIRRRAHSAVPSNEKLAVWLHCQALRSIKTAYEIPDDAPFGAAVRHQAQQDNLPGAAPSIRPAREHDVTVWLYREAGDELVAHSKDANDSLATCAEACVQRAVRVVAADKELADGC